MARKSRKAEQLKQEIISSVPAEQRKMITQPVTFAYLKGEMSMMQTRIQTIIMEKLQEKIKKAFDRKIVQGFFGDLFDSDDYKPINEGGRTKYLTFSVQYAELGIEPQHYNDVDRAAKAMQSIIYEKKIEGYNRNIVVFDVVDIPDKTKGERHTDIKLHMTEDVAKDLLKIIPYQQYLKDAIFLFSSNYAGRIYLLINANKELGTWVCPYEKLRKILLTAYDEKTKTATVDKYRDINDFKKRVLEPARKEILEAADRVDCTFDYEFQYPEGKKRGTPEAIIFHIHLTDMGRNIRQRQLENHEIVKLREELLSMHFTIAEANSMIRQMKEHLQEFIEKVKEQKTLHEEAVAGHRPDINDPKAYILTALRNFIIEKTTGNTPQPLTLATPPEENFSDYVKDW